MLLLLRRRRPAGSVVVAIGVTLCGQGLQRFFFWTRSKQGYFTGPYPILSTRDSLLTGTLLVSASSYHRFQPPDDWRVVSVVLGCWYKDGAGTETSFFRTDTIIRVVRHSTGKGLLLFSLSHRKSLFWSQSKLPIIVQTCSDSDIVCAHSE